MKELGKLFYQLAGYSYAGMVVGAVMNVGADIYGLLELGGIATFGFALLGFMFCNSSNFFKKGHYEHH